MIELISPVWVFIVVLLLLRIWNGVRKWRQNTKPLKHVVWDVREKKWKAAALKNHVSTSEKRKKGNQ